MDTLYLNQEPIEILHSGHLELDSSMLCLQHHKRWFTSFSHLSFSVLDKMVYILILIRLDHAFTRIKFNKWRGKQYCLCQ